MLMTRHLKQFLTILLCFVALWLNNANAAKAEYRLSSGDRIKVVVFGHEDLSGEYEIDQDGLLIMPLIKSVKAGGLTVREIEKSITDKLQPDYLKNPQVGVVILEYRPLYILGEVNNPGSYPYRSNLTLSAAIALAGGYTYRARKNQVIITRAGNPEGEKVIAEGNTSIQPGDVIEVPERFF